MNAGQPENDARSGRGDDAVAAAALVACFAVYLWLFLPAAPGFGPMYAADYSLHMPNLLAGYFHFLANGPLSVPWFSPAECGGVPFIADLNVAFYSLPQVLTLVVDPANAVRATFVVFAALGLVGFAVLLRSRFGASPWAAATAAVLFLFNGFFVVRMAVGHLTFHPFMLAPWIAWAALLPARQDARWTWRRVVLGTVMVGAIFAYQFQAGMQHIIIPVALAAGVIVLVHGHRRRSCLAAVGDPRSRCAAFGWPVGAEVCGRACVRRHVSADALSAAGHPGRVRYDQDRGPVALLASADRRGDERAGEQPRHPRLAGVGLRHGSGGARAAGRRRSGVAVPVFRHAGRGAGRSADWRSRSGLSW